MGTCMGRHLPCRILRGLALAEILRHHVAQTGRGKGLLWQAWCSQAALDCRLDDVLVRTRPIKTNDLASKWPIHMTRCMPVKFVLVHPLLHIALTRRGCD